MPEGDTIHQVASYLRPRLCQQQLRRVDIDGRRATALEQEVLLVEALGKHLLIGLPSGDVLRVHLGMHGSWHRYAIGESWHRAADGARLALWTSTDVYVCFQARDVAILDARRLRADPVLGRLGPDLLRPPVDLDAIAARSITLLAPDRPVVDLLLDQRVAAGLGNVYKNEVLSLHRLHPRSALGAIAVEERARLFATGQRLLQVNRHRAARNTVDRLDRRASAAGRLWVYRRGGHPCRVCGARIVQQRLGFGHRDTFWCPSCQPEAAATPAAPRRLESRRPRRRRVSRVRRPART